MRFKQEGAISALNSKPLKSVDHFTHFGSNISSTKSDFNTSILNALTTINWQLIMWKYDISYKIKRDFFQAEAVSVLLSRCTTWTLTKSIKEKAKWELHNKTTCCYEQILGTSSHKTAAARQLTSNLSNCPKKTNETYGTLLEKQGRLHE